MKKRAKKLGMENPEEIVEQVLEAVEAVAEDTAEAPIEATENNEENPYTACPTLEKYIEDYGYELGVDLFRRFGENFEEAESYDYQQLKKMRMLAENEDEKAEEIPAETIEAIAKEAGVDVATVEEIIADEQDDEKTALKCNKKLSLSVMKMAAQVARLNKQIKMLSNRGAQPVSAGAVCKADNRSAIQRYADKIARK